MTRLINNTKTQNSRRTVASPNHLSALVIMLVVLLTSGLAHAQDSGAGSAGQYRAEKTVNDYMNETQPGSAAGFDYAGNSLRAEVWVDKSQGEVYRKGEHIGVGFQTNQDAYAVVYRIDTEGLVTVLWPRSRFDDGFIFGGHEYKVPVSGAGRLRVSNYAGEGIVEAVVSQYPFDLRSLELDFHHENTAERHNFRVAGDPFLAMNEVNYAVTGLEDSGEYVVTNYASYYVHTKVDHPRYLCNQCHVDEQVAYDPYDDHCAMTIEYDYSWYNGWYDSYGYYPVYGNPVYVYIDPWNSNPWVNYWYTPSYVCAPWYGWGWGWNSCYGWYDSPYYYGNCATAYDGGYRRHRPLNRTQTTVVNVDNGVRTKTREYTRGSSMVGKSKLSDRDRSAMVSRSRTPNRSNDGITVAGRSGSGDPAYRGSAPTVRNRASYDRGVSAGRGQGGLRIRESGRSTGAARSSDTAIRKRHTSAGEGREAGLVPVNDSNNNWRGTTRVDGRSPSGVRTPTTVGNSAGSGSSRTTGSAPNSRSGVQSGRTRSSTDSKSVESRKRSTRVWNSPGTSSRNSGTSNNRGTADRTRRSEGVNDRGRSGSTTSRQGGTVSPRRSTKKSSGTSPRSSSSVKKSSSRSNTPAKSGGSKSGSRRSGSSSSREKSGSGSSKKSGGRGGSSRR